MEHASRTNTGKNTVEPTPNNDESRGNTPNDDKFPPMTTNPDESHPTTTTDEFHPVTTTGWPPCTFDDLAQRPEVVPDDDIHQGRRVRKHGHNNTRPRQNDNHLALDDRLGQRWGWRRRGRLMTRATGVVRRPPHPLGQQSRAMQLCS